jgi:hypothetical protein
MGKTNQIGLYPILEHATIFVIYKITNLNSILISQYFNALFSALTVIPIFLLIKKFSNTQIAFLSSIFWAFSEAVFYRSAIFSSTETFAFFLAIFALYFYSKKQYLPTVVLISLSFYTHLLPAFFLVLTIFLHQFFIRSKKAKILITIPLFSIIIFLLSPLNPHQRLVSVLNPATLLTHFNLSNLFVYSLTDLAFGIIIFLGIILLSLLTLISLVKYKTQNKIIFSMLVIAISVFIFSWIVYSPNLFAPPRLTFYFVIPLSFYTAVFITKFNFKTKVPKLWKHFLVLFILISMICSSIFGSQTMLFYQNSVTKNEYLALNDLNNLGLFNIDPSYWWSDYPIRISISAITLIMYSNISITTTVDETSVINNSIQLANQNDTLKSDTIFKYIFFSERMEKESFFTVFTNNRTTQIREPLNDIWSNSTMWELIYSNYGVKVYAHKI